jgi:hypothetical protein
MIPRGGGEGRWGGIGLNGRNRYEELGWLCILESIGPIVLRLCRRKPIGLGVCGGRSGLCGRVWRQRSPLCTLDVGGVFGG